jgi:hypothetical protein
MPTLKLPASKTTVVGVVLHATTGSWNESVTLRFQWLRCDRSGAHCTAISGATQREYRLQTTDAGSRLRVRITAIGSQGAATVVTKATSAVAKPKQKGAKAFALGHARQRH